MGLEPSLGFAFQPGLAGKAAIMAAVTLAAGATGIPGGMLQLTIAGWAVVLCLALPRPGSAAFLWAAKMALTVYLMHPLVLALGARILHLPAKGLAIGLVGLSGTLILSAVLHALAYRRRAIGQSGGLPFRLLGV
jgi:fucose 4-O-acetylase-like acetyltransferase